MKKTTLSIVLMLLTDVASADITTSLIGHWPCQDNAASTTVAGLVGGDGTLTGAGNTSASSVAGPNSAYPLAISLDGVNDSVPLPDISATSATATFSMWIKRSGTQSSYTSLLTSRATSNCSLGLSYTSTDRLGYYWDNLHYDFDFGSDADITDNTWTHIAVTVSGTAAVLYVNGASVGTNTATHGSVLWGDDFYISDDNAGDRFFTGAVADVRVYNRTLSPTDIQEIYELGSGSPLLLMNARNNMRAGRQK